MSSSRDGHCLQQAVLAMHEVKKAANVFVDSSGAWFLGDFGASNMFGDKITHCTEVTFDYYLIASRHNLT